jgi:hypothetical protein
MVISSINFAIFSDVFRTIIGVADGSYDVVVFHVFDVLTPMRGTTLSGIYDLHGHCLFIFLY